MKSKKIKKINIISDSGFTITDLAIAMVVFLIFTSILGTLFYNSFKTESQSQISGAAMNYAIQVLEDIDKRPYEEIQNGMESEYMSKFSIPTTFNLKLEVSSYNEGISEDDLIKTVTLIMKYEIPGDSETIMINKLKIKEM